MWRHAHDHIELEKRIRDGQLGEIIALRAYRTGGRAAIYTRPPKSDTMSELLHQVQRFHSFLWASGGVYSDFYVHHIDECCWMKGLAGRSPGPGRPPLSRRRDRSEPRYLFRGIHIRRWHEVLLLRTQHVRLQRSVRQLRPRNQGHGRHLGQWAFDRPGEDLRRQSTKSPSLWKTPRGNDCYQEEWNTLIAAIRNNEPYNEVKRGAEASLVTAMGRMAAHTGRTITFEQALAHPHELGGPDLDKLTFDSPSPLKMDAGGKYPIPQPGIVTDREY